MAHRRWRGVWYGSASPPRMKSHDRWITLRNRSTKARRLLIRCPRGSLWRYIWFAADRVTEKQQKERGSNLRWSPSTVRALPGMCPNRSSGRDLVRSRPQYNLHVVGALGVLGDVETFPLHLNGGAQADDDIDDLVEDRRTDARPHQRGADAPGLRDHLRREVVVGDLAGGVIHDARATEGRIHQDAGAERADDAADAVDAEHVEGVVVAERVLDHGAEEQADHTDHEAEHDRSHRTGITGCGRDRDKSRHRARNGAEHGRVALDDPLREHP